MSGFLQSSIGKKLLMSVTGLFLILFLVVHFGINFLIVLDPTGETFNKAAHFMATNVLMHFMEPVLALGFVVHIVYSVILTVQNRKARPVAYSVTNKSYSSSWASKNMFVIGGLVFVFLVIHLMNFFVPVKFGGMENYVANYEGIHIHDTFTLVTKLFGIWWYTIFYVIGAVLLALHLTHAFWSAWQTLGLSNNVWRKRLVVVGNIYTIIIAGGFGIIPLIVLIFM